MMNLKTLFVNTSLPPDRAIPKWIPIAFLVIALLGFTDAAYLTILHYLEQIPPCSIVDGCEEVTTSEFSALFGVPISLFGALYYLFFIGAILFYFDTKNLHTLFFISLVSITGFLVSLFLLYLQLFVLNALCLYCLFSLFTSTLLFLIGMRVVVLKKRAKSYE